MNRRCFLAISAACLAAPAAAEVWRGRALGAEVSIRLSGGDTGHALAAARDVIARMEGLFSLFDPGSALSRLNREGRLAMPPGFDALVREADRAHRATGGLFDPTVQPLWRALATGGDVSAARAAIGWDRVRVEGREIALEPGMALTFNGIAQGFATDRVTELLLALGYRDVAVNIGEWRTDGHAALLAPSGRLELRAGAVATSEPGALSVGGEGHILSPFGGRPAWRSVTVVAERAVRADALSTALCLAPDRAALERIAEAHAREVIAVPA